ncbi:MAG: hypothetical protein CMH52_07130 [Myxococcales bacterium]|nr:hypothetical protein [Myxococcales bacterium]
MPGASWGQADSNLLMRFNDTANQATEAEEQHGIDVAIAVYEEALLEPENDDYGGLHLRLGQLQTKAGRTVLAAYHFSKCVRDERVDPLDRDVICKNGFKDVTAALTVVNLPFDSIMTVVEPPQFAGPFKSGNRLPKGIIRLEVRAPGQQDEVFTIALNNDLVWQGQTGLKKRRGPLVPDEFLVQEEPVEPTPKKKETKVEPVKVENTSNAIRWPSYLTAALGAGLVGAGIGVGIDNRSYLDGIREREKNGWCAVHYCLRDFNTAKDRAQLADGLWIGGAVTMATSLVLWFLLDGETEAQ